jgi:hypothetical protein
VPRDTEQALPAPAERLLAPVTFALLAIATLAAFAFAQKLKHEPLILDKVAFSPVVRGQTVITPNGDGHGEAARIVFRLTRSDRGTVAIINKDDRVVRTLSPGKIIGNHGRVVGTFVSGGRLPSFKTIVFRWNGRTNSGRIAPTGPYRLRVRLAGEDRTLIPLERIRLHAFTRVDGHGPAPGDSGGQG